MAYNGLKVLGSDMHGMEPADLWERSIDDAYTPFAPHGLQEYIVDLPSVSEWADFSSSVCDMVDRARSRTLGVRRAWSRRAEARG